MNCEKRVHILLSIHQPEVTLHIGSDIVINFGNFKKGDNTGSSQTDRQTRRQDLPLNSANFPHHRKMCEVASFKNFENSLTNVKVMTKTKVASFYLGHGVLSWLYIDRREELDTSDLMYDGVKWSDVFTETQLRCKQRKRDSYRRSGNVSVGR